MSMGWVESLCTSQSININNEPREEQRALVSREEKIQEEHEKEVWKTHLELFTSLHTLTPSKSMKREKEVTLFLLLKLTPQMRGRGVLLSLIQLVPRFKRGPNCQVLQVFFYFCFLLTTLSDLRFYLVHQLSSNFQVDPRVITSLINFLNQT